MDKKIAFAFSSLYANYLSRFEKKNNRTFINFTSIFLAFATQIKTFWKANKAQYIFLLFFTTFHITTLFAQSEVLSGVVKMANETPVVSAIVKIKSLNKQSITNERGEFSFKGVRFGKYLLEISSIEISNKSVNVDFTNSSKYFVLTVEPSKGASLEEVAITVKSEKKEIATKGYAVEVIETQKFALQSIQTNELLDRTAGLRIRQDGGLGSRINYNINGLSGSSVKIFIDGIPSTNYGPSFSLNSIPPALIERIEVYKGVVPATLSDDALGGAINIVLKKKTKNSFATSYSYGSFNTHQWNASGNYRKEDGLTTEASLFYNYSDNNYKVWGKNIAFKDYSGQVFPNQTAKRFHDAYESYGIKGAIGYTNVKWADRFMIGGVLSKDHKDIQHGITMDLVYGDRFTRRNANIATLTYSKQNFLLNNLNIKIDANYSHQVRQVIDTVGIMYDWSGKPIRYPNGEPVRYTSGAEVASAKTLAKNGDNALMSRLSLSYSLKENHKIYFNYMFNGFKRDITDELQPIALQNLTNTRDLQKNIFAFTYENISFSNKLRTNLFVKEYLQKATSNSPYQTGTVGGVPTYNVNKEVKNLNYTGYGLTLSYTLNQDLYLLGSAEKAIRLPNENELFGNANDNLLAPSDGLNPEVSYNANIGINWSGLRFDKHSIRINSSIFYRDTRGMIREAIRAGSFTYSQFENLENVMSKGFDAEITYNYAQKFNATFNISKFDVLFNTKYDKYGSPYLYYRMQIRNEPSFKYNINLAYNTGNLIQKKSRTTINYNINYVNRFLRNWSNIGGKNLDYIPTQFSHNVGLSYTLPSQRVTFSFDGKNITNQQVFDNFGLQKPGRAFFAKINYIIN